MGKSLKNYIAIKDTAADMYGKVMSLPDELIVSYFTLATDVPFVELRDIEESFKKGSANPRDMKARLAREVVMLYHGALKVVEAEEEFNRVFRSHEMPTDIPEIFLDSLTMRPDELLVAAHLATSKAQAQRIITQGGFKVAGLVVGDWKQEITLNDGDVAQAGKRTFVRIRLAR